MRARAFIFLALTALAPGLFGCSDIPPVPASHDPEGADLVEGAVVAAVENSGGIRLNKIVKVDDFPKPLDYEFHMVAFDPKAQTWEEASRMWKNKQVQIIVDHFIVRRTAFMERDYRVLYKEPLTAEERAGYDRAMKSMRR